MFLSPARQDLDEWTRLLAYLYHTLFSASSLILVIVSSVSLLIIVMDSFWYAFSENSGLLFSKISCIF